jgi:hypothetical protein
MLDIVLMADDELVEDDHHGAPEEGHTKGEADGASSIPDSPGYSVGRSDLDGRANGVDFPVVFSAAATNEVTMKH